MIKTLWPDLRHAARSLRLTPGITIPVLLTLAIGIGATTTIFAVVNAALLKPLPYPDSSRLFVLGLPSGSSESGQVFLHVRERSRVFEAVAAQSLATGWNVSTRDASTYVTGLRVSAGFFEVHGVPPLVGRGFERADDEPNGPNVVVVRERLWRRLLGGRADALGETLQLGGAPYTLVGVMPDGFRTIPEADLWTPLRTTLTDNGTNYRVLARLADGRSAEEAAADLDGIRASLREAFPRVSERRVAALTWMPYRGVLGRGVRQPLLVLLGAVAFLFLITCSNVASLQMVRAVGRRRETATRVALGATRGRLVRHVMAEAFLVAAAGAAGGFALASVGTPALLSLISPDVAGNLLSGETVALDWRVVLATATAALAAGFVFAFSAIAASSHGEMRETLGDGERATANRRTAWMRRSLAIGEVALAVVLLVGSGLLVRTFLNLTGVDPGFDPSGVVVGRMSLQGATAEERARRTALFDQALARIRQIPGVTAAAATNNIPVETGLNVSVQPPPGGRVTEVQSVDWRYVTPDYFTVFRTPMRTGRVFEDRDNEAGAPVAIVNETFARQYFNRTAVVGERIQTSQDEAREIVGVVADVKAWTNTNWTRGLNALGSPVAPAIYVPAAQAPDAIVRGAHRFFLMKWVVRTSSNEPGLERAMQDALRAVDPALPFVRVHPMSDVVAQDVDMQRLMAGLVATFALVATLLAAVGLYGLIAHSVRQRTREVGIRMAFGATGIRIVSAFMAEGVGLALFGLTIGLAAAGLVTEVLAARLYGVEPLDGPTFIAAAALLLAVAAVATFVPAARASRTNPVEALRS